MKPKIVKFDEQTEVPPNGQHDGEPRFSRKVKEEKRQREEAAGGDPDLEPDRYPSVDWAEVRNAIKTGREKFVQEVIYPEDSILTAYVDHVRQLSEGVDSYIVGSI